MLIQSIDRSSVEHFLLVGIGDDTAVICIDEQRAMLFTCDFQLEGHHFRFDHITPDQLGRRSMAANVSVVGAMGGSQRARWSSLGSPPPSRGKVSTGCLKGCGMNCNPAGPVSERRI